MNERWQRLAGCTIKQLSPPLLRLCLLERTRAQWRIWGKLRPDGMLVNAATKGASAAELRGH
jgi:hypothetical protein